MKNTEQKQKAEELESTRNRQEAINNGLDNLSVVEYTLCLFISLTILIITIGVLGILSYNKMKKNELALQSLYEQIQEEEMLVESTENNDILQDSTLVSDN